MTDVLSREEIRRRVDALGPWFHNLNLKGVSTAPSHFLGDYPQVKWRRFAGVIPETLHGKTVLDIGCNAGFYAMEMKRRGAARVLGLDTDDEYLAQARFAAEVSGLEIEFRKMSAYDVGQLGTIRSRDFHGSLLPPSPPPARTGLDTPACRTRSAAVPIDAAWI